MSGNADTSPAGQPEDAPPPREEQLTLELTTGELEEWLNAMGSESDPEKKVQSIFSARSGIQDLLQKSPPEQASQPTDVALPSITPAELEAASADVCPLPRRTPPPDPTMPRRRKSRRHQDRVRRRQMSYLQKRREQKRLKVFYNRVRLCFKLAFAVMWAILLWEMLHSPLWNFSEPYYKVHNQRILQAGQLEPLVKAWVGKPIYAVDTGQIEREIKSRFDIVEHVSVRRRLFPAKLDITIQEKKPWAEIYQDEKQARPYALMMSKDIISLAPYRYGESGPNPGLEKIILPPSTPFKVNFLERLRDLAWDARQINGLHLKAIDARNTSLITLHYAEVSVILGRLNKAAPERLVRLIPLVPKIKELGDGIEAVDLRWEEQVTLHTRPETPLSLPADPPSQE